jgi:hypothetical protein
VAVVEHARFAANNKLIRANKILLIIKLYLVK